MALLTCLISNLNCLRQHYFYLNFTIHRSKWSNNIGSSSKWRHFKHAIRFSFESLQWRLNCLPRLRFAFLQLISSIFFLVCFFVFFFSLSVYDSSRSFLCSIWSFFLFTGKAVPFVELTVAHASVLTILAISFERYYAICEPLKAGYVCTKTRALMICLAAWAVAAIFTR